MLHAAKWRGIRWCCGLAIATTLGLFSAAVSAAEHPEHPEHPKKQSKGKGAEVTKDAIAKAIRDYAQKDMGLKGGYFLVYDPEAKKPLALTLDRVHDDKLCQVSERLCFACADFKTPEGKVYDLDFFVKHTESGLEVTEISIHKENGKPRYNWAEKDGVWSKKGL